MLCVILHVCEATSLHSTQLKDVYRIPVSDARRLHSSPQCAWDEKFCLDSCRSESNTSFICIPGHLLPHLDVVFGKVALHR